MPFRSLRARLLVAIGTLVVCLTGATLAYVGRLANQAVSERVTADLVRSREVLAAAHGARYERLALVARLLASFPELMALMGTDAATVRDFLADYRERNARDELLLAVDASGVVVARSDTFATLALPDAKTAWLEPALAGRPVFGLIDVEGRPYHMALVPAEAGGTIFGFVAAAAPVDDRWAAALRDAAGREIAVLRPGGVAGTTLASGRLPWQSAAEVPPATGVFDVDLGGERFEGLRLDDPHAPPLTVVALQSLDLALAPYRNIQRGLVLLGILAAALGIGAGAMLARTITAPVAALSAATREVAQGRLDVKLAVTGQDELGQLSQAFNQMTAGLRERADMQKFVSQSTVDMIQRGPDTAEARAGARRVITLLFVDIRGFTAFAGQRIPEVAVAVLNRYLQLLADVVARFAGDVDKFLGDGLFAHFSGADQALDAIRCALEMHRAVGGAVTSDPDLPPLEVGIGIATGEVIVGSVGGANRRDYTVVGAPVNLAARLCAAAEPGETLLNDGTYDAVRGLVAAEPAPPLMAKGFSEPVRAFRMRT